MAKLDSDNMFAQTDNDYLIEKIIEGRVHMNKINHVAPSIVDLDAIAIHNEYFANNEGPSLSEVVRSHGDEARAMIKQQEDKIRFKNLPVATQEKLKRILRTK